MSESLQSSVLSLARDARKTLDKVRTGYINDSHKKADIYYKKGQLDIIIETLKTVMITDEQLLQSWRRNISLMRSNLQPEEDLVW